MKFYEETRSLYLETDASGIGPGATLLQINNGATYSRNIAPDNTVLRTIMFASKSQTSMEQRGIASVAWS